MNISGVFITAICTVIASVIIKKHSAEYSLAVSILGIVIIFLCALSFIDDVLASVSTLDGFNDVYIEIPIKILGVSIFSNISTSICDDAGEKSVSIAVGISTKIACVLIALPLFEALLNEVRNVLLI